MLQTHFREELPDAVAREFDAMYTSLQAKFYKEHNEDGTHRADGTVAVMTRTHGLRVLQGPLTIDDVTARDRNIAGLRPHDLPTGTYHDFAPPGVDAAYLIDLAPLGAVTLTGIRVPPVLQKRFLKFRNRSTSAVITFPHQHTGSLEQHRFANAGAAAFSLQASSIVDLYYDPEIKRWTPMTGALVMADVYTPTILSSSNLVTVTAHPALFVRINDVVHVSGRVTLEVDHANVIAELRLSLPIQTSDVLLAGTLSTDTPTGDTGLVGDDPSHVARLAWQPRHKGVAVVGYSFFYRVG